MVKNLDTDYVDEEAKEAQSDDIPSTKTRSNILTVSALLKVQLVLLLFGCKPADGVKLNTKMIADLVQCLYSRIDMSDLSIEFPAVLEHMSTSDCNFELTASNTIRKMKLFYSHNVASVHKLSLTIHNSAYDKPLPDKNGRKISTLTEVSPKDV